MTHRIERVPAGSYSAEGTITKTAHKMQSDTVGATADIIWMNKRVAEIEVVRTSIGPMIALRTVWPQVEPWQINSRGMTAQRADIARQEINQRP